MRDMMGIPPLFQEAVVATAADIVQRQLSRACRFRCDSLYDGGEYNRPPSNSIKKSARDLPQNMPAAYIDRPSWPGAKEQSKVQSQRLYSEPGWLGY
jgi:hypothetical protein